MKSKLTNYLALLLVLIAQISFAQVRNVSGTVTDKSGLPLPGVSILVKGTSTGTQTDFDGKFSLAATPTQLLIFSYVGMKPQEIAASSTTINVKLEDDAVELEGVVINALGVEVNKSQVASSVSRVKGSAIKNSGEQSLLKGLSGKAAGVSIVSNSGDPGAGAYIQIRGQNSITGSTQPLFVVDGIPVSSDELGSDVDGVAQQSRLNDINPNDIESVQILKGASASALWGYRAANGVVLITTKKGKKGKISVEISSVTSYDKVNVAMDLQDKFGQGTNGAWVRNNANSFGDKISTRTGGSDFFNTSGQYFVSNSGNTIYPITTKNSTANFNQSNMDAVIGNGNSFDNHVGISGGSENSTFYLGLGNVTQDGIIRNSGYERTSIDFKTTTTVSDKTSFKAKFNYSSVNSNRVQQGSNLAGLYLGLYRTPADFDNSDYIGTNFRSEVPWFNSQRAYRQDVGTYGGDLTPSYNNPLWTTDVQRNPNKVDRYIGGFEIKHDINSWASIIGRLGIDGYTDKRITMFPINSAENGGNGSASESVTDYSQYNADIMLLGDVKINNNIDLNYITGINFGETRFDQRGGTYKNFLYDTPVFSYDNALILDKTTFLDRTYSKLSGAYFSGAFDYKNYLFLTAGGRFETTSAYGPNVKVYFYPSVELGYKFTENMKKNEILTDGKLRLTFGQIASIPRPYAGTTYFNSAVGVEGYGPAYDSGAYNGSFQQSGTKGNPNLKPEIKTEIEFGADLEFFSRIKLTATYYTNETKDLLVDVPLNGSSTFSSIYGNFATIQNKGFELDFNANMLPNDSKLKWTVFGNWSTNRNEVTKLEGTESLFLAGFTGSSSRAVLGQPLGVLWGGKFDRDASGSLILDSNGFPTVADSEGVIGDPNPKWRGAIGTSLGFKNFTVSTLFDASIGGQLWDGTNGALNNFGRTWETANEANVTTAISNYAGNTISPGIVRGNIVDFGGGPVLLDQSWYQSVGGGFGPVGEQFVKSASWVKWRELSLSYFLSLKDSEILGLESVTFTATGRNLWLWTEDKTLGQDPETNLTGGSNGRGLQYFNSPNTKSFLFSVNLKF